MHHAPPAVVEAPEVGQTRRHEGRRVVGAIMRRRRTLQRDQPAI